MVTNTAGDSARLFPWQMSHYIVRGGVNDPVQPSASNAGGIFSFNSTFLAPPIPGASPAVSRAMSIGLTGTLIGGILIGTIPQGAWITGVGIFSYTSWAGGSAGAIGLGYAAANSPYPPTLNTLATSTLLTANVLQQTPTPAGVTGSTSFTSISQVFGLGPQAAVSNDIDVYVFLAASLIGGLMTTAATSGNAAVWIEFTGLEG